jgi:hypothetical protein
MRLLSRVIQTTQQRKHTMDRTTHQTQLPLASETADHPLPEAVIGECRQLIAQLLREVLLAEKEAHDEH